MRLEIAAQSDTGRRKKNNEDYYGVFREDLPDLKLVDEGALLVVADGLGGHMGGEIASKLAVNTLRDMLRQPPPEGVKALENADSGIISQFLRSWMDKANQNVYQTNLDFVKSDKLMGSTLLAALVQPHKVFLANVGDSRAYHIRDGEILTITVDHSWVDEQVKAGLMSKSEAESDARKNIVTRSIGTHEHVESDFYEWDIQPGDRLLLCTDGLVNMVKDDDIIAEFRKLDNPAELALRLVNLANENGGKDNITVIIAEISPSLPRLYYNRLRFFMRKHKIGLWWVAASFLLGALCFAAGLIVGMLL